MRKILFTLELIVVESCRNNLLYALGMDQEGIMDAYYETVPYKLNKKKGWVTKFFPDRVRGTRPAFDLVDAATGEVIAEAGKKVTPRAVKSSKMKESN